MRLSRRDHILPPVIDAADKSTRLQTLGHAGQFFFGAAVGLALAYCRAWDVQVVSEQRLFVVGSAIAAEDEVEAVLSPTGFALWRLKAPCLTG